MGELVYRPAELDDAALAADLMTAAYPALPEDPVLTRYRWEQPRREWSFGRFIAEMDGRPIAFLDWLHGPPDQNPERHCEVSVYLDVAELDVVLLTSMWLWVARQAEAAGSQILEGYCGEDEPEMLEALARAGFERDRQDKVWELDLKQHGDRLVREAGDAKAKVAEDGITLLTVAAWPDPEALNKLHVLDGETRKDVPSTFPNLPETFADFTRRVNSPDRPHDRWWIALDGDRPVAMSYLKFPPIRGAVWTGYTACDREYRGRGIARAVKLQTLAQAGELGIPVVQTDNDSENAPMLHINEALGYRSRPGFVSHLKRVGKKHDG
ncbi:MAG TPA: GNAT family N-acetyltransferase [Candidatus Dormibacteraeota bacterium]|nr:GNAT family N-acetyltransferase [Candidatus Dormibacteraeota bacterium]